MAKELARRLDRFENRRLELIPQITSKDRKRIDLVFSVSRKITRSVIHNSKELKKLPLQEREIVIATQVFKDFPELVSVLEKVSRQDPEFYKQLSAAIGARVRLEAKNVDKIYES